MKRVAKALRQDYDYITKNGTDERLIIKELESDWAKDVGNKEFFTDLDFIKSFGTLVDIW